MKHKNTEELNNEEVIANNNQAEANSCCCNKNCSTDDACTCEENCNCGGDCTCDESCSCGDKENDLSSEVQRLTEENLSLVEKVKLAQAELINYRRRKDEETTNLLKYANQDLVMELITLVDNFERAIKLDDNILTDELSKFLAVFKMMYASLTETLKKFGVEEINRPGEIFDPSQEQALMTDHVDGMGDDVVIEVLLKGYKLKDRVIRPASVKINQN